MPGVEWSRIDHHRFSGIPVAKNCVEELSDGVRKNCAEELALLE